MLHSRLFIIALLAASPMVAGAQFTTFIPQQNKAADSVKAVVVAEQKAQADSAAKQRLTNMKEWVDSAAGVPPTPTTAADSLARSIPDSLVKPPLDTLPARRVVPDTAALPNGARAPNTASMLPLMVFAGGVFLVFGAVLFRRAKPARTRA